MPASFSQQFLSFFRAFVIQNHRSWSRLLSTTAFYALCFIILGMVCAKGSLNFAQLYPLFGLLVAFILLTMSLPQVFQEAYAAGLVESYVAGGLSMEIYGIAAILSHWLYQALPLCVVGLGMAFLNNVPLLQGLLFAGIQALILLIFCFLSGTTAAFGVGLQGRAVLLGMLVLPLSIPSLLIGLTVTTEPFLGYVGLLFGLLLITAGISLVGTGYALRWAVE